MQAPSSPGPTNHSVRHAAQCQDAAGCGLPPLPRLLQHTKALADVGKSAGSERQQLRCAVLSCAALCCAAALAAESCEQTRRKHTEQSNYCRHLRARLLPLRRRIAMLPCHAPCQTACPAHARRSPQLHPSALLCPPDPDPGRRRRGWG